MSGADWKSIDSAPKDGTRVLVYRLAFVDDVAACWWSKSDREWIAVHGGPFPGGTHWQPYTTPDGITWDDKIEAMKRETGHA